MKLTSIPNNTDFRAKLFPYPKTITNKNILENFEQKTKKHPNLILKQDNISFFDNDQFLLLNKNGQIIKHKTASFTKNRAQYKTEENITNRLVEIFNSMLKEAKTNP